MEPATELDFVLVEEKHVDALLGFVEKYYAYDGIPFDRDGVRRGVQELLAAPALGAAWLIQRSGRWIGHFVLAFSIDLEFGGRQATLTEIFIDEGMRRYGIGSAAVRFVESVLRDRGIHALELQVEEDNAEARAFYARMGFEAHARIPLSRRIAPA